VSDPPLHDGFEERPAPWPAGAPLVPPPGAGTVTSAGATAPAGTSGERPGRLLSRELSTLAFNRRVLAQARDPQTPLLERLRFLTICSRNLDEFFEIRVSELMQRADAGIDDVRADGMTTDEALRRISAAAHELVEEQYRVLNEELLPALADEGIDLAFREQWTEREREWADAYFHEEVLPVLTPVGLDPAHPFPLVQNKSLNFIVSLRGKDAFGRLSRVAVVQAPRVLPRLLVVPADVAESDKQHVVTLTGVIHENVAALFPGMEVTGCYPFRVTRDSDLWVDEEEVDDLMRALKGELRRRHFGRAVRLEVGSACPREMCRFLLTEFELGERDLYQVDGPVNLPRLAALNRLVARHDLEYPRFVPSIPREMVAGADPFSVIRAGNVLLHHPYQSFMPVLELLQAAARDPDVLAIKITLYRTGAASPLTDALLEASRNSKEVTTVIELRARFDEEANIDIATRLQEAGVRVAYGIVGHKAHAKMMLIVRREADGLRRYVHLGTGNYHMQTTRLYTDLGLLSCDETLGQDVHNLFQQLTGLGRVGELGKLVQSPFHLHQRLLALIDAEADAARRGRRSGIRAKMNGLSEPTVIEALYRASQAGVPIDLVVRGVCALRPGVPGLSETIHVRSIVGRFLEHSRVYHFHADGRDLVYCASADWMPRNLLRRVEAAFPIEDEDLKRRVLDECLDVPLADDTQAWALRGDGTYERVERRSGDACCSQSELMARWGSPLEED